VCGRNDVKHGRRGGMLIFAHKSFTAKGQLHEERGRTREKSRSCRKIQRWVVGRVKEEKKAERPRGVQSQKTVKKT